MFYEILKQVCSEKKTTPSAVCVALKMSKSNVTAWKKGRSPKIDTVMAIAEHLKVNPMKLLPKRTLQRR